jgi:hypothetical protein
VGNVNKRMVFQAGLGIKARPIRKITKAKGAGNVAQVEKCLPSKHKTEFKPQCYTPAKN